MKRQKIEHVFTKESVENKWDDLKQSIENLHKFYKKKIFGNNFTLIGPIDVMQTIVPEDAIETISHLNDTDNYIVWVYLMDEYHITFVGTNIMTNVSLTFVIEKDEEESNEQSKSIE